MTKQFWKDFLVAYMSMPCLWKVKSPDYTNRVKKKECYAVLADICREFEPTADIAFVQRKINSFRTTFRKEHRKVTESKMSAAGTTDALKSTLWYYDILLPIALQGSSRPTQSKLEVVELTKCGINNLEDNEAGAEEITNESEACASVHGITDNVVISSASAQPAQSMPQVLPTVYTKRMWQESRHDEQQKITCEPVISPAMEYDEFYHFGMSIAINLRKMSKACDMQCVIAEKLISDVIFHGHMQALTYDMVIKAPEDEVN